MSPRCSIRKRRAQLDVFAPHIASNGPNTLLRQDISSALMMVARVSVKGSVYQLAKIRDPYLV